MKAFLLVALFISFESYAQDERFYRKIFTGELTEKTKESIRYKVTVSSPRYEIDINQDKSPESIKVMKRDGFDFFLVYDEFGREIFNKRLPAIGANSRLIKVDLKAITKDTNTLILHFYEGAIEATRFEAMAKLFFVTFNKKDIKKMTFFNGPHFFHEKEKGEQYLNRRYTVNSIDYNKDGRREISISYNKIQRVFYYTRTGQWKQI